MVSEVIQDWLNGWSQTDIAYAHGLSRKAVRIELYHSPEYRAFSLEHRLRMRERKNRAELYAEKYQATYGYPSKFSRQLAHANQRDGLRARYNPDAEESIRKSLRKRGS